MEQIAGLPLSPVSGPTLCRSQRRIRGRVRPRTAADVAAVVRACAEQRWPLHPVSGGKNWGMGSYLPDHDDCVLLDLSALKTIGPIDRDAGSVRIEAGVTQKELYDWLQREAPEFAFNVTGAGKDTSIVGNALERGLGYEGSRAAEFFGLEAVLSDGTEHRPGEPWFTRTGMIPAGPRIEALFSQSNLAVVTAGWLKLRRRCESEMAVVISGELRPVFDTVAEAYRRGLLMLPVHMAGNARADAIAGGLLRLLWGRKATLAEIRRVFPTSSQQTALAALHGTSRMNRTALAEIRRLAGKGVKVRSVTENRLVGTATWLRRLGLVNKATFLEAIRPLLALTWGEPTDAGLASLAVENPDTAAQGCIYFSAVTPSRFDPSAAVEAELQALGASYALTRYFMAPDVLVHVVSVEFEPNRQPEVVAQLRRLGELLRGKGWPPYRLGVPTMTGTGSRLAHLIKQTLDSAGMISPAHYIA